MPLKLTKFFFVGVLQEPFVQPMLKHYYGFPEEAARKWKEEHRKSVQETVKIYLVKYLGKPLHQLFR